MPSNIIRKLKNSDEVADAKAKAHFSGLMLLITIITELYLELEIELVYNRQQTADIHIVLPLYLYEVYNTLLVVRKPFKGL